MLRLCACGRRHTICGDAAGVYTICGPSTGSSTPGGAPSSSSDRGPDADWRPLQDHDAVMRAPKPVGVTRCHAPAVRTVAGLRRGAHVLIWGGTAIMMNDWRGVIFTNPGRPAPALEMQEKLGEGYFRCGSQSLHVWLPPGFEPTNCYACDSTGAPPAAVATTPLVRLRRVERGAP